MNVKVNFKLYVTNKPISRQFYQNVLGKEPDMDIPEITEFRLNEGAVLSLIPVAEARRQFGDTTPDPEDAKGIPRIEVSFFVEDPGSFHNRAIKNGAKELIPLTLQDWGHEAAYSLDPDGHVLLFVNIHPASE